MILALTRIILVWYSPPGPPSGVGGREEILAAIGVLLVLNLFATLMRGGGRRGRP